MVVVSEPSNIQSVLAGWAEEFSAQINEFLDCDGSAPPQLVEAMRYSMLAPGKRLRPFLVDRCYRLAGGEREEVNRLCLAVECLHVFTLIHDDLPAMDDADLRRGRPSSHKAHGEACAILAGDALLAYGLELAADGVWPAERTLRMVKELCSAIGWQGVIGGQAADILNENQPGDMRLTEFIHRHKTARLFEACCRVGAMAAGADETYLSSLSEYGLHLGLAFQIADDLLDATGSAAAAGKNTGRDAQHSKQTYPQALGIADSQIMAEKTSSRAVAALDAFGTEADELRLIARYVVDRRF